MRVERIPATRCCERRSTVLSFQPCVPVNVKTLVWVQRWLLAVQDWNAKLPYAALAQHCYGKWGADGGIEHLRSTSKVHSEVVVLAYFHQLAEGENVRGRHLSSEAPAPSSEAPNTAPIIHHGSIRSKERLSLVKVSLMKWDGMSKMS